MPTPQETLRAQLNTRMPAPTATPESDKTPATPGRRYFRVIGRGTCGTIYEHSGLPAEVAIKVGSERASIKRDFNHSLRAFNATKTSCPRSEALLQIPLPLVPRPRKRLDDNDLGRLGSKGLRLEAVDAEICDGGPRVFRGAVIPAAWEEERIGAVSEAVRDALVDLYVEPDQRPSVKSDDENRDCLIRVYLGAESPGPHHLEELRNAPLYLDQMISLQLDTQTLAKEMAMRLATCHWGAGLDGMDIEFVLGAPRLARYRDRTELAKPQPAAKMWMLDYDKTTLIPLHGKTAELEKTGEDIVSKFSIAIHGNDPYYPRPSLNQGVWDKFAEIYILGSRSILRNTKMPDEKMKRLLELPKRVIERLKELYDAEERWQRDASELVGFEDDTGRVDKGWGSEK
ncbi:hypothetical protein SCUP234_00963 [Seiridium cupressi]